MSTKTSDYFDLQAKTYLVRSNKGLWGWQRNRESQSVLKMLEDAPKNSEVLELGCGAGFYMHLLSKWGFTRLTGLDSSKKMLENIEVLNCKKILGDVEFLDLSQKYDVVLCAGTLEFVLDPQKIFYLVARILSQGGRFVLLVPKKNSSGFFYRLYHRLHGIQIQLFTTQQISEFAKNGDFVFREKDEIRPFSMVFCFEKKSP